MRPVPRVGLVFALAGSIALTIALPAHATSLVTWYDATALSGYSDGAAVGSLADLSGSGNTGWGLTPGSYVSSGIGGQASVRFASGATSYSGALQSGALGILGDNPWTMCVVLRPEDLFYTGDPYQHVAYLGDATVANCGAVIEFDYTVSSRLDLATGFSNDLVLEPGVAAFSDQDTVLTYVHTGGGPIASTTQLYVNGYAAGEGQLAGYTMATTGNADTATLNLSDTALVLGWHTSDYGWGGLLSEFRLYSGALSDDERQQMTDELGDKYDIDTKDIPEPGTAALFGLGLGALVLARRRRGKREAA
jgi:hypothetical protein